MFEIEPIIWDTDHPAILDQSQLPHRQEWLHARTPGDGVAAIREMWVRGAPAIITEHGVIRPPYETALRAIAFEDSLGAA